MGQVGLARRKLQKSPIAGTRRFDISDGQLIALADDGSRFPAAIDPESDTVELIFVDEEDPEAPEAIDVTQKFIPPTPILPAPKAPKKAKAHKSSKGSKSTKGPKMTKARKKTKT